MWTVLLALGVAGEIEADVRKAMKAWEVPGCAVVVVRGDRVTHCRGYGVRQVGREDPVTPETLFPLSSCTKGFTTAVLAQMVEEKKLAWDDPVRRHLPWFRLADPLVERETTLRDVLCHRTGLDAHVLLWHQAPWPVEEGVRRLRHLPMTEPFRTTVRYQSSAFAAAGLAAAAVEKTSWSELVKRRLLAPLGMKGTYTSYPEAMKGGGMATGHRLDRAGLPMVLPRSDSPHADPAVSIYSCAQDLGQWLRFQLAEGKPLVAPKVLRETHRGQMTSPLSDSQKVLFPNTGEVRYGLGWAVHDYRGLRVVSHGGAIDGFRVHVAFVPSKGVGVGVLCNLDHTPMPIVLVNRLLDRELGFARRDWQAIHRAFQEQRAREQSEPRRMHGTRPSRELAAYVGEYEHPAYDRVQIGLSRGRLVWRWRGEEQPLEHFHHDTFALASELVTSARVTFALDASGEVSECRVSGRLHGVPFRKIRSPR